jgi:hypothetical protein
MVYTQGKSDVTRCFSLITSREYPSGNQVENNCITILEYQIAIILNAQLLRRLFLGLNAQVNCCNLNAYLKVVKQGALNACFFVESMPLLHQNNLKVSDNNMESFNLQFMKESLKYELIKNQLTKSL